MPKNTVRKTESISTKAQELNALYRDLQSVIIKLEKQSREDGKLIQMGTWIASLSRHTRAIIKGLTMAIEDSKSGDPYSLPRPKIDNYHKAKRKTD